MSLPQQPLYNALIRRSIDLQRLCKQAAQQAAEPGLRAILQENAASLEMLILDLQMQLTSMGGHPATHGRWSAPLRRRMATWWVRSAPRRDNQWIHTLARSESALLQAFEEGMRLAPAETALYLRRLLPRMNNVHLDMHSLARAAR
jgi:uncharacterized protein (TIGR02284 family)